ncbi:hypothetical protein JH06_1399 [Blastocystis sp. subtype 4]|uniref:hypothetical protein n=1 Tax=Blastocystis sp. subtype 4 TaxID=944170 RepID=UPI000711DD14|nr:hypothetical protein JH06_1399 [Blastocystis sp. subtype 4]KNB46751.1 hypothetical protein JH06_1399 [Blastocystis sp. subtype 4]|eukprot:XP_014530213.1 hypothetical protein JH06_1399 [Blastocystis sp. subtype 4]
MPGQGPIGAFEDPRFSPIRLSEVKRLQCTVSLLYDFEDANDPMDWEVKLLHGIIISFEERNRHYRAVYLPEVATEQGWDKEETLEHLIEKSGYYGST